MIAVAIAYLIVLSVARTSGSGSLLALSFQLLYKVFMQEIPKGLIDSHFHLLSMQRKGFAIHSVLSEMAQAGMRGMEIGLDCDDLAERTALFAKYPFIQLSAGIGPWGTADDKPSVDSQVLKLAGQLSKHSACAIGEIGLDNYWKYGTPEKQMHLLQLQLDLSQEHGLPVIFHNREADEQFEALFKTYSFAKRGILHCFQGSEALAMLAVEKGFYLSFAGPLTYKANARMQDIFSKVPLENLLLETDSPYLSPVPMRGKPNTPMHVHFIYEAAARLRNIKDETLIDQIGRNYQTFLSQGTKSGRP